MKCNDDGLDLIKRYEGFSDKAYLCPAGVWTIGYGHTTGVNAKTPSITKEQGDELLRRDVRTAEDTVSKMHNVPLNENQFSALASLVFNIGAGNYRDSTLRALINRSDFLRASDEFLRWNRAAGKVMAGLTARRREERALFLKPVLVA